MQRFRQLLALHHNPPYLTFYERAVGPIPDVSFLPKIVFDFYTNMEISLLVFFQSPVNDQEKRLHSLNVKRRCFSIGTRKEWRDIHLLVSYAPPRNGWKITALWIISLDSEDSTFSPKDLYQAQCVPIQWGHWLLWRHSWEVFHFRMSIKQPHGQTYIASQSTALLMLTPLSSHLGHLSTR